MVVDWREEGGKKGRISAVEVFDWGGERRGRERRGGEGKGSEMN